MLTDLPRRLVAVAIAIAAAVPVWIVASIAGVRLEVTSPVAGPVAISIPLVLITAAVAAAAAWALLAVLERRSENGTRVWTITAVAVLVVSVVSLFLLGASLATVIALGLMHLAVGLTLIVLLPRRGSQRRATTVAAMNRHLSREG
ncbi:DUF6069 family protein [Microbacterium sp. zg.B48]|uniref:DUF6069 family protein n=1 Tax=unclassified Microbacterium TaxID=2609290 RepID=UPI00214D1335|nr:MULTISPECIES: DUF6069 family protein [unclassified Microbacterium]MCR2762599.1 DUF6069 family protein [Microbacterium sp. zg.B48]MCR2810769.1 DUF6069 family protein [Microbacterium sp. zg.B185]WIM18301.1 DUF6069 family protein [Microbacterium sp. zg-B185]